MKPITKGAYDLDRDGLALEGNVGDQTALGDLGDAPNLLTRPSEYGKPGLFLEMAWADTEKTV